MAARPNQRARTQPPSVWGGQARAAGMSAPKRWEIATKAAKARWGIDVTEDPVVLPLLNRLRFPRQTLIDIGIKVGGERANVAECEPPQVAGFEPWRWGTRFFREDEALKVSEWEACERDQVSGIRNPKLGIKLVVCATSRTGSPESSLLFCKTSSMT